jgi:hypothetical protein
VPSVQDLSGNSSSPWRMPVGAGVGTQKFVCCTDTKLGSPQHCGTDFCFRQKIDDYPRCQKSKGINSLPRQKIKIEIISDIDG